MRIANGNHSTIQHTVYSDELTIRIEVKQERFVETDEVLLVAQQMLDTANALADQLRQRAMERLQNSALR